VTPTTTLVATELRDGLLQDLVALGLILRQAERPAGGGEAADEAGVALTVARSMLAASVDRVRTAIDRLGGPR
jgi:signal transduction histidine kinase